MLLASHRLQGLGIGAELRRQQQPHLPEATLREHTHGALRGLRAHGCDAVAAHEALGEHAGQRAHEAGQPAVAVRQRQAGHEEHDVCSDVARDGRTLGEATTLDGPADVEEGLVGNHIHQAIELHVELGHEQIVTKLGAELQVFVVLLLEAGQARRRRGIPGQGDAAVLHREEGLALQELQQLLAPTEHAQSLGGAHAVPAAVQVVELDTGRLACCSQDDHQLCDQGNLGAAHDKVEATRIDNAAVREGLLVVQSLALERELAVRERNERRRSHPVLHDAHGVGGVDTQVQGLARPRRVGELEGHCHGDHELLNGGILGDLLQRLREEALRGGDRRLGGGLHLTIVHDEALAEFVQKGGEQNILAQALQHQAGGHSVLKRVQKAKLLDGNAPPGRKQLVELLCQSLLGSFGLEVQDGAVLHAAIGQGLIVLQSLALARQHLLRERIRFRQRDALLELARRVVGADGDGERHSLVGQSLDVHLHLHDSFKSDGRRTSTFTVMKVGMRVCGGMAAPHGD
mmetsp:Transcript_35693/g.90821  ORF Transcript_35693/g.90821 Transcript_35693/m.90821 type:complete len:517 (+) Transcript_35693:748-2298(+)